MSNEKLLSSQPKRMDLSLRYLPQKKNPCRESNNQLPPYTT